MESQSLQALQYSSLEWRFQTQLSSRVARDEMKPEIILKFELKSGVCGEKTRHVTLACDVCDLVHIQEVLEEALMTARSQHLLKMMRRMAKQ